MVDFWRKKNFGCSESIGKNVQVFKGYSYHGKNLKKYFCILFYYIIWIWKKKYI